MSATSIGPGNGNVYRLGGGLNTPVLNVTAHNALVGENDLVVGMPIGRLGAVLTNGSGTVVLKNSNSFSGRTTVNMKSVLAIEGAQGIGGGSTPAGPINVDGTMIIRSAGTLGQSGPITINYGGLLQIDDTATNNPDRIPDGTPIRLRGGTLSYFNTNSASPPSSETIGQAGSGVTLLEGDSTIDLTPKSATATSALTIGEIHRQLGSTLELVALQWPARKDW